MQIIKDKQLTTSDWVYIANEAILIAGNVTVSLTRWKTEKALLKNHQGQIGVRLDTGMDVNELINDVMILPLIELNFPAFNDGRGFSQARRLRKNLNFQGEIRAVGYYMSDQVFYLSRMGVNAFQMNNKKDLDVALSTLNDFSIQYQA